MVEGNPGLDLNTREEGGFSDYHHEHFHSSDSSHTHKPAGLTLKGAFVRRWRRPVMSVVIGRRSADGRGRGAAGAGLRRGHGGRLKRAAVERTRQEGAARGPVALGQRGGGGLGKQASNVRKISLNGSQSSHTEFKDFPGFQVPQTQGPTTALRHGSRFNDGCQRLLPQSKNETMTMLLIGWWSHSYKFPPIQSSVQSEQGSAVNHVSTPFYVINE